MVLGIARVGQRGLHVCANEESVLSFSRPPGDVLSFFSVDQEYRRDLRRIDFRDLPRRNRRLLATLDDIVERVR